MKVVIVTMLLFSSFVCANKDARNFEENLQEYILDFPSQINSVSQNSTIFTKTYTDSQGRTTLYRYSIPDDFDINIEQKIGFYFHGNNTGTQENILDSYFGAYSSFFETRGIIPVFVTSPETRPESEIRHWYEEDKLLIQELLQSNFENNILVDFDEVYFTGASQGTCFLNDFIRQYGEFYGGGFFSGCGCNNSISSYHSPSQEFKNKFKVFIHSTSGDFLYDSSQRSYHYYKYILKMNTRSDMHQEGGHCSRFHENTGTGLDWLIGNTVINDDFEPHWERVVPPRESDELITGFTIDSSKNIWVAQQDINDYTVPAKLWKSVDKGENWLLMNDNINFGKIDTLNSTGNRLIIFTNSRKLYLSEDMGSSFQISSDICNLAEIKTDNNSIFCTINGYNIYYTDDLGGEWTPMGPLGARIVDKNQVPIGKSAEFIAREGDSNYVASKSNNWEELFFPENIYKFNWDALSGFLWAIIPNDQEEKLLYKSDDFGNTWEEIYIGERLPNITQIHSFANIVIRGGSSYTKSFLSFDQGSSWQKIIGTSQVTIFYGDINNIYTRSFFSSPMRLVLYENEELIYSNGFEINE